MLVFRTSVGVVILGDEKVQETDSANLNLTLTPDPDPSETTADEFAIENQNFDRSLLNDQQKMVSLRKGASQCSESCPFQFHIDN